MTFVIICQSCRDGVCIIICQSCRDGVCITVVQKPGVYRLRPLLLYVRAVGMRYV